MGLVGSPAAERPEHLLHRLGRNARAGVPHGELDSRVASIHRRHLDPSRVCELERVGHEVEQHAPQDDLTSHPIIARRADEVDLQVLLFRHGADDARHGIEHLGDGQGAGVVVAAYIPVVGRINRVVRDHGELRGGDVDQPQLASLQVVHGATARQLQPFRQAANRRER